MQVLLQPADPTHYLSELARVRPRKPMPPVVGGNPQKVERPFGEQSPSPHCWTPLAHRNMQMVLLDRRAQRQTAQKRRPAVADRIAVAAAAGDEIVVERDSVTVDDAVAVAAADAVAEAVRRQNLLRKLERWREQRRN